MMEMFGGIYVFNGEFFLRKAAGTKSGLMLLGVMDDPAGIVTNSTPEVGQFWVGNIQFEFPRRFEGPDWLQGYRADQILCQGYDLSKLKEIT
jgi:hypothetical protein